MNKLKDQKWWEDVTTRIIKTAAQTAVALIGTNTVGITDVDWIAVASASALAGVVCFLMNLAALPAPEEE